MSKMSNYQVELEEKNLFVKGLMEEAEGKKITPLEIESNSHNSIFDSILSLKDPFADEEYNEIVDLRIDDLQERK